MIIIPRIPIPISIATFLVIPVRIRLVDTIQDYRHIIQLAMRVEVLHFGQCPAVGVVLTRHVDGGRHELVHAKHVGHQANRCHIEDDIVIFAFQLGEEAGQSRGV